MRSTILVRGRGVAGLTALILAVTGWVAMPRAGATQEILRVGESQDHATIQGAVDAASPGDLVLVHPGTYHESVTVPEGKPGLTIRGLDRNEVVLDGRFELQNAITALADDTTLENMTAHSYTGNGFYWRSMRGYRGRYLTTYRVGLYGIYAFDSVDGLFEKSYGSGSGDASFYIGQCRPCDAVVDDVIAEHSALGFSGTNAGGNLTLKNSVWRSNGTGIVPNSLDSQRDPPQRGGTNIVDNTIVGNGNADTPASGIAGAIIGHGVAIAGGSDNVIQRNVISDHPKYGVVLHPIPGGEMVYVSNDNSVRDNHFADNDGADMAVSLGNGTGNCFSGNEHTATAPAGLEDDYPCDDDSAALKRVPLYGDADVTATLVEDYVRTEAGMMERISYRDTPVPEPQPTMPDPDPEAA